MPARHIGHKATILIENCGKRTVTVRPTARFGMMLSMGKGKKVRALELLPGGKFMFVPGRGDNVWKTPPMLVDTTGRVTMFTMTRDTYTKGKKRG